MSNPEEVTHPVAMSDTIGNVALAATAIDAVAAPLLTLIGAMTTVRTETATAIDTNVEDARPATNVKEKGIATEIDVADSKSPVDPNCVLVDLHPQTRTNIAGATVRTEETATKTGDVKSVMCIPISRKRATRMRFPMLTNTVTSSSGMASSGSARPSDNLRAPTSIL